MSLAIASPHLLKKARFFLPLLPEGYTIFVRIVLIIPARIKQ
jgi:hypothetical protein